MFDDFSVSMCLIIGVIGLGLGVSLGKSYIQDDCEKIGSFHRGDKVYICEIKK